MSNALKKSKTAVIAQHCPDFGGSTISGLDTAKSLLGNKMDVHVVFSSDGKMLPLYKKTGCYTHIISEKCWLQSSQLFRFLRNWTFDLKAINNYLVLFRKISPNLVIGNTLVSLPAAIASKLRGIPFIWHAREMFEDMGGEMKIPPILGKSFACWVIDSLSTTLIVNSPALSKNLNQKLKKRANVIPNCVPNEFFHSKVRKTEARKLLKLPKNVFIVGIPGTIRPVKGHLTILRALPSILQVHPSCYIAITGTTDNKYFHNLTLVIQKMNLTHRVQFLGPVKEMIKFYAAVDLICVPSEMESFGRVVVEAFAMRKPVVASGVGGISEIVTNGIDGLLAERGNSEQFAEMIIRMISNPNLCERISKAARVKAEENYSEQTYHEHFLELALDTITIKKNPELKTRSLF